MLIERELTGITVNTSPGFTAPTLHTFAGTETVERGARQPVSALDVDGPTGCSVRAVDGEAARL
ncbi:hypothetical protein [Deinococcus sonorensis]|uniref:Uncharacterized protein n=2 Tax=Deinococcus sonorensis TaxID=309891 RepID=A0AAU7U6U5_9DEIO